MLCNKVEALKNNFYYKMLYKAIKLVKGQGYSLNKHLYLRDKLFQHNFDYYLPHLIVKEHDILYNIYIQLIAKQYRKDIVTYLEKCDDNWNSDQKIILDKIFNGDSLLTEMFERALKICQVYTFLAKTLNCNCGTSLLFYDKGLVQRVFWGGEKKRC